MEKLAFLLHFYQPITQEEKTLREIADSSYIPLLKLIKNKTKSKFTLNVPLSLLEQMDKYGYTKWLEDLKSLVDMEAVELVGSSAYHYLLTKFPDEIISDQIVLNEFGLGYYFGRRSGFEGEKAIMIKDLNGFFPPEMAINSKVHNILNDFGYAWVYANSSSTGGTPGVYRVNGNDCLIVARNRRLSDHVAFSRGAEIESIVSSMKEEDDDSVIAMDAETFGHHNRDGIFLLNRLIDALSDEGIEIVGTSEFVEIYSESEIRKLDKLEESTWATPNNSEVPAYRFWEGNNIQVNLWDLAGKFIEEEKSFEPGEKYEDLENTPFWKKPISDEIDVQLLFNKVFQSDQFWWASGAKVGDTVLYNGVMIDRALELYRSLAEKLNSSELGDYVEGKKQEIEKEMKEYENSNTSSLLSTS